jgi:acetyltransferase-like isoleucine patch superfamily enzyme
MTAAELKARIKGNRTAWRVLTDASTARARLTFRAGCRGAGNRLVIEDGCMIRGLRVDVRGDANTIVFGSGAWLIGLGIVIRGNGNKVTVGPGVEFSGPGDLWVEDDSGELRIGDGCTFEPGATLAVLEGRDLTLGKDCMVAADVEIRTGDSHPILEQIPEASRINLGSRIQIGDHVWLGKRVVVLKGIELASGIVVGVGSIVTKSELEADVILAGNPARVVRRQVRWER